MSGARGTRAHRAIFLDNADRPGADALADRLIGDHQDGDVVVMAGTRAGERAPDPDCSFGQEDLRFSHEEAKALLYNRLKAPDPDVVADMILLSAGVPARSEEHTSELQSLMRISYAVFCLKQKKQTIKT